MLVYNYDDSPHAALAGATGQELCFSFGCAPQSRESRFRCEVCGRKRSLWASLLFSKSSVLRERECVQICRCREGRVCDEKKESMARMQRRGKERQQRAESKD